MSILKTKNYWFNKENGSAYYEYSYKGNNFVGTAHCHEDDIDFKSELVGIDLAEKRAYRKFLMYKRDELAIKESTILSVMKNLSGADIVFQARDEYRIMTSMLIDVRQELVKCRESIVHIRKDLDRKIVERDEMYKKVRRMREEAEAT